MRCDVRPTVARSAVVWCTAWLCRVSCNDGYAAQCSGTPDCGQMSRAGSLRAGDVSKLVVSKLVVSKLVVSKLVQSGSWAVTVCR